MTLPYTTQSAAFCRFDELRMQIQKLALEAAALPGIPKHWTAQMRAVASLAALRLTRIAGDADSADALSLRDDLEAIWRAFDPFISAIGKEAADNFNGIDQELFDRPLEGALDGNATHALEQSAEKLDEELRIYRSTSRYRFSGLNMGDDY